MPRRSFSTRVASIATVGPATLVGRVWRVQPLLPTPLDLTPQAAAYRAANADKEAQVDVWRGIRYGQPPVGALRWQACVPYVYPPGRHEVSAQPRVPFQTSLEERGKDGRSDWYGETVGAYDWPGLGTREDEDILTLNVFRPRGLVNRPVITIIHGGGWCVYHALAMQQLGHRLAAQAGCVVVTVEYRLSTFGHWPNAVVEVLGEPSVAYTDIKAAVKWVHDNIAAFGGDPARQVAFGTSAGGAAVLMLMSDPEARAWLSGGWSDSGGGSGAYMAETEYAGGWRHRTATHEAAIRGMAGVLRSGHPAYRTVQEAITAMGFAWAMQHAVRPETIQALADIGPVVTSASVRAVIFGTGDLEMTQRTAPENVYPFRRDYPSALAAALAGEFDKPMVLTYAECEALNLLGSDYQSLRTNLLALPAATLDGWAQRLGYADYAGWLAGAWQPAGGLEAAAGAQFRTDLDPLAVDCENRRVLYTQAVFGYPAWRIARAMASLNSAPVWLGLNNFSANSVWAGHSMLVSLMTGNAESVVAGGQDFPDARPPGVYFNSRMDGLYVSDMMMAKLARFAATGDPEGDYSYAGFDLFAGNPPADGGNITGQWQPYSLSQPGHHNIIGKYYAPYPLNAGTYFTGTGVLNFASQRDAKTTHADYMGAAYLEYLGLLEP